MCSYVSDDLRERGDWFGLIRRWCVCCSFL